MTKSNPSCCLSQNGSGGDGGGNLFLEYLVGEILSQGRFRRGGANGRQLGRFRRGGALGHQLGRFRCGGANGRQLRRFRQPGGETDDGRRRPPGADTDTILRITSPLLSSFLRASQGACDTG